jgi:hypothetical protein
MASRSRILRPYFIAAADYPGRGALEEVGRRLVRPISARYMHAKEVASYEKENPQL